MRNIFKIWIIFNTRIISHRQQQFNKAWWIRPLFKLKPSKDKPKLIKLNRELTEPLAVANLLIPQCKDIQMCKTTWIIDLNTNRKRISNTCSNSQPMYLRAQGPCRMLLPINTHRLLEIANNTRICNVEMEANQELTLLVQHPVHWVEVCIHLEAQLDLNHIKPHLEAWYDQELKAESHQPSQFLPWSNAHATQTQMLQEIPGETWSELIEAKSSLFYFVLKTLQTVACADNFMLLRIPNSQV